ncbi:hypothetical protein ILUMI_21254 [Ignelater luminosus]|uniref:Uncharacterized protein n=1 Tax=Ignelater luminosus TaxID=2038154 RepID=A0A8K0CJ84_IGNLU|nr:hypothetical protein ILUMI_21254 [Ignelater luminosus]
MKGMQPSVRAFTCSSSLKQDVLPLLSQIIVPSFRPVNLHLFTEREKEDLNRVVSIMIDYNLSYVQERMPEGNYIYTIDPNIEEATLFPGSKHKRILSYFNKQLIAREIEVEKMRRTEIHKLGESSDKKMSTNKKDNAANVPNHLQKLKAKTVKPKGNSVSLFICTIFFLY